MRSAACLKNVITQAIAPYWAFWDPLLFHAQGASIPTPQASVGKLSANKLARSHPAACSQAILAPRTGMPRAAPVTSIPLSRAGAQRRASQDQRRGEPLPEFSVLLPEPPCPAEAASGPHGWHSNISTGHPLSSNQTLKILTEQSTESKLAMAAPQSPQAGRKRRRKQHSACHGFAGEEKPPARSCVGRGCPGVHGHLPWADPGSPSPAGQ